MSNYMSCPNFNVSHPLLILTALILSTLISFQSIASTTQQTNIEASTGHSIYFSVNESQRVDNDLVSITFRYVAQAATAELVMQSINQKMQAAIQVLKRFPKMETQTSQYQVRPIYNKQQIITHWQGQQNLTISTANQAGLPKLLAQLQPYLNYQSMRFHVSEETQKFIKNNLLKKALTNYQEKAKYIASSFGATHYQLLETRIDTPNLPVPYINNVMRSANVMSEAAIPVMEAGKSDVKVQITGKILIPH